MLQLELSRKSVNNTLGVLSALVKYAVKNKLIADPEIKFNIQSQDVPLQAASKEDVDDLAAAADARYRIAILLAADAGLRIGEIRALPRLEVNEIAREITVAWSYDADGNLTETKGWERRTVPLSDRLWAAMRDVPADRPGSLVFARINGDPISYAAVRERIHEIYIAAKVKPQRQPWHALRHTFGTELANSGAPVHLIRELMGHKSIETTLRYMHTNREQKRSAIKALKPSPRGSGVAVDPKAGT
jgi:integrase